MNSSIFLPLFTLHLIVSSYVFAQGSVEERVSGRVLLRAQLQSIIGSFANLNEAAKVQAIANIEETAVNSSHKNSRDISLRFLSEIGHLDVDKFITNGDRRQAKEAFQAILQTLIEGKENSLGWDFVVDTVKSPTESSTLRRLGLTFFHRMPNAHEHVALLETIITGEVNPYIVGPALIALAQVAGQSKKVEKMVAERLDHKEPLIQEAAVTSMSYLSNIKGEYRKRVFTWLLEKSKRDRIEINKKLVKTKDMDLLDEYLTDVNADISHSATDAFLQFMYSREKLEGINRERIKRVLYIRELLDEKNDRRNVLFNYTTKILNKLLSASYIVSELTTATTPDDQYFANSLVYHFSKTVKGILHAGFMNRLAVAKRENSQLILMKHTPMTTRYETRRKLFNALSSPVSEFGGVKWSELENDLAKFGVDGSYRDLLNFIKEENETEEMFTSKIMEKLAFLNQNNYHYSEATLLDLWLSLSRNNQAAVEYLVSRQNIDAFKSIMSRRMLNAEFVANLNTAESCSASFLTDL